MRIRIYEPFKAKVIQAKGINFCIMKDELKFL